MSNYTSERACCHLACTIFVVCLSASLTQLIWARLTPISYGVAGTVGWELAHMPVLAAQQPWHTASRVVVEHMHE